MDKYLNFAIEISEKAGKKLHNSFKNNKANKRGTSKEVKSVLDNIVDDLIKRGIEENFPTHSYLTEESGLIDKGGDFLWIIDPLDGTGNYENHNPFYSVSVSLWKKGVPVLGIVEAPSLKERFVGASSAGSSLIDLESGERRELAVSSVDNLKESYFIFCEGSEKSSERIINNFKEVYSKTKDFRKIGSAALELAWIASGRAEGYITYEIPIWDIAAGLIILNEAGGDLFNFNLEKKGVSEFSFDSKFSLLATNGNIPRQISLQ